jgi:hypothetical protein
MYRYMSTVLPNWIAFCLNLIPLGKLTLVKNLMYNLNISLLLIDVDDTYGR